MKNYIEVRNWLENFIPLVYGKSELGLDRISNLLLKLGNPQKKFKSILVGGTAGKGSTAFYIARLLKGQGLKVGLHVSPHLIYIGERMQINGVPISVKRLVGLANEIKPVVDDIKSKQPELVPSYFEILVALSFLYFAEEKVDWAVVEVGLGGRLDATNILSPEICVITNVGLEHTEILGDTIKKIAIEKAGIIKAKVSEVSTPIKSGSKVSKGMLVVTGATGKGLKVIENVAKSNKAILINISTLSKKNSLETDIEQYIARHYYRLRCKGHFFAVFNKNLALLTVLALKIEIGEDVVKSAFSGNFVGRFEEIDDGVIVDGAHNTDKMKALIDFVRNSKLQIPKLKQIQKYKIRNPKITLVVAFKKGKNWQEMIDLLLVNLPIKKIIATQYFATTDMGKGSAVAPEEIARYLDDWQSLSANRFKMIDVKVINNSQEAVFTSLQSKIYNPKSTILLVTGSLYLVGEARTMWYLPSF